MSQRQKEIYEYYQTHGAAETAEHFGLAKGYVYTAASRYKDALAAQQPSPKKFVPKPKAPVLEPAAEPAEPDWLKYLEEAKAKSRIVMEALQSAAADPPPSPPSPLSLGERLKPRGYNGAGINYEATARFLINRIYPQEHSMVWSHLRCLLADGYDLKVISPYHSNTDGEHYFSIEITNGGHFITAHLYGLLNGTKFNMNRATVRNKCDEYEMNFVTRNTFRE